MSDNSNTIVHTAPPDWLTNVRGWSDPEFRKDLLWAMKFEVEEDGKIWPQTTITLKHEVEKYPHLTTWETYIARMKKNSSPSNKFIVLELYEVQPTRCTKCRDIMVPTQLGSSTFVCYTCNFDQLVGYSKCPLCESLMIPTHTDPTKLKCYWLEEHSTGKTCRCGRCGINTQNLGNFEEFVICDHCKELMKNDNQDHDDDDDV